MEADTIWARIGQRLQEEAAGTSLSFTKREVPHPRETDAYLSSGWPMGQRADFRFPLHSPRHGIHVVELEDQWVVTRDRVSAVHHSRVEHSSNGAVALLAGGAALGAALGATLSNRSGGVILGAAIGLLAGALLAQGDEP